MMNILSFLWLLLRRVIVYVKFLHMKSLPFHKRNLSYYIKKAFLENPGIDLWKISDFIIKDFKKLYITESDAELFKVVLKKDVSQSEFDDFIKKWDIEEEGGHKALLLSYFMKTHPDLTYPEYIEPRLKGILQFYRFKNLKLISHFINICNKLKEENIDILIIKGGAIKHYRPDLPRMMNDIDILVRNKEDYDKCRTIVEELGYSYKEYAHSMDLLGKNNEVGALDIHCKLQMISKKEMLLNEDLFARAHLDKVFNVENIYVPCCEDMMFIALINLAKNLIRGTSYGSMLHTASDCMFWVKYKPDFDWNIVIQNAKKTGTKNQIYIAIKYLNEFLPEKLPEIFKKGFRKKSVEILYNKLFLKNLAEKNEELKFTDIFKSGSSFLEYLEIKPKYFIYKRKMFRENIKLAKRILERQRMMA